MESDRIVECKFWISFACLLWNHTSFGYLVLEVFVLSSNGMWLHIWTKNIFLKFSFPRNALLYFLKFPIFSAAWHNQCSVWAYAYGSVWVIFASYIRLDPSNLVPYIPWDGPQDRWLTADILLLPFRDLMCFFKQFEMTHLPSKGLQNRGMMQYVEPFYINFTKSLQTIINNIDITLNE